MNLFKKNTWQIFYSIIFVGGLLLSAATYIKYQVLLKETRSEQLYVSKTFNNHLTSLLTQYETVLDLISDEFSQNKKLNIEILDNVVNKSHLLVGIAIFSVDGTVKISTSNLAPINYPNLLKNPHSRAWFKDTLNRKQMVVGKPYFFTSIEKWLIPVRKRVMDRQGKVIAVISSGVDLVALSKQWDETEGLNNTLQAVLDKQFFHLLHTGISTEAYEQYYNTPITTPILKGLNSALEKQKLTFEELRHSGAYIQMSSEISEQATISTLTYNQKYRFWVLAAQKYKHIYNKLYDFFWPCLAFYLFLIVLFFILFKWIIRIEKSKISELTHKAEYDALTGLPNRTFLNKQLHELQSPEKTPFSLLYIDLDNFKNINDMFGHSYGDLLLIEVTKRINESLAPYKGFASRYSGDEFVIFIESEDKEEIAAYARFLLKSIALPYLINSNTFKISSSIGIARFPDDAANIETLLSYADNSMFLAKKKKNHYLFFSKEVHHQLMRNIEIEQALHRAIINDEISLVYQPQLDREQKLFGVEALVRWNSKKLGFIAPDLFIPIAEETGLMPKLGLYIMHKAMKEIAILKKQEGLAFKLSINVSVRQFMQIDFIEKLLQACTYYSTDKAAITIEITESLFIESLETLSPLFHKMKANAISLSLDDFGTGYSSLSMLRKVPIDELKIDKSFVDHIATNNTDRAMVKNIIRMGKELGITVLAEGVETAEQVEILQQADCDIFQGYYFSKPLSLNDLTAFAKEHKG